MGRVVVGVALVGVLLGALLFGARGMEPVLFMAFWFRLVIAVGGGIVLALVVREIVQQRHRPRSV